MANRNDPRTVVISFVGDADDIDLKIERIKKVAGQMGTEIASGFTQVNTETGKVRGQFELLAQSVEEAANAYEKFSGLQKSVGIASVSQGRATPRQQSLREQEGLKLYDKYLEDKGKLAAQREKEAALQVAEEEKASYRLRQSYYEHFANEVYDAADHAAAELERLEKEKNDRLAAQFDQYVKAQETRSKIFQQRQIEAERQRQQALLELARREQESKARLASSFNESSARLGRDISDSLAVQQAAREGNKIAEIRARLANKERLIAEQKNTALLSLAQVLEQGLTTIAQASSAREVYLQRYKQEINAARDAAQKLIDIEQKKQDELQKRQNVTTFGQGLWNMTKRVIEVNLLWNAVNSLTSAVTEAVGSIIPLGIQLDAVHASLESTVGSAVATAAVLQALREESQRTGIEIGNLRSNFKLFQASTSLAGASLKDTWKMFTNINTVSAALHLTQDQTNSVFLAMAQIFNKSKVQAEELVRQLGNLLPGAFASFAASMGISTSKLIEQMEKGQVFAQQTMLKFTQFMADRFAGSFAMASQMLNADLGRMRSQFTYLAEAIYHISGGPIQNFVQGVTSATTSLTKLIENEAKFNKILNATGDILATVASVGMYAVLVKNEALIASILTSITTMEKWKGAWAFIMSPGIIVAGLTAITMGITDYLHSLNSAVEETYKFVDELQKQRNKDTATPEIQLQFAIDEDATVKKITAQLDAVAEKIKAVKAGDIASTSVTSAIAEQINGQIGLLQKYDATITKITEEEQRLGMTQEKSLSIYYAYMRLLSDELGYAKERAKLEEINRQNREAEMEQKNRFGSEPAKKVLDSDVLKADIQELELKQQQAKAQRDLNEAERIGLQIVEKQRQLAQQTTREKYKDQLTYIDNTLEAIRGRMKDGKYQDKTDEEEALRLLGQQAKINRMVRGDMAEADKEFLQKKMEFNTKELQMAESQGRAVVKQAETQKEELKTVLQEEENKYKQGLTSIATYYETKRTLLNASVDAEIKAAQQRYKLVKDLDKNKAEQYQAQIDKLNAEKAGLPTAVEKERIQDLQNYNKLLQETYVNYLKLQGKYGEAAKYEFMRSNGLNLKRLEATASSSLTNRTSPEDQQRAADALEMLRATQKFEEAQGLLKEQEEKSKMLQRGLAKDLIMVGIQRKIGSATELTTLLATQDAYSRYIADQEKIVANMEKINTAGNNHLKMQVEEARAALEDFKATSHLVGDKVKTTLAEFMGSSFENFITGARTASQAFADFGKNIIGTIAKIVAQEATSGIVQMLFKGAMAAAGGMGFDISGWAASPAFPSEKGNIVQFAKGGLPDIGSEKAYFPMRNGGLGSLRERGPEAIMPLIRDASGNLGVKSATDVQPQAGDIIQINVTVERGKGEDSDILASKVAERIAEKVADRRIQRATRPGNLLNKATSFG
jgi:tape measure domain-containing protein